MQTKTLNHSLEKYTAPTPDARANPGSVGSFTRPIHAAIAPSDSRLLCVIECQSEAFISRPKICRTVKVPGGLDSVDTIRTADTSPNSGTVATIRKATQRTAASTTDRAPPSAHAPVSRKTLKF
jgi:hypothetical protein